MDAKLIDRIATRKTFLIDHNMKYLEFTASIPNNLNMLREIANSLPEGKRRASMTQIIEYINNAFTEVLKDFEGLQEGSHLRNALEDAIGSLVAKEKEIEMWTNIVKSRKK